MFIINNSRTVNHSIVICLETSLPSKMAAAPDFGAPISLSRDISPTSDDSSAYHSRRSLPTTIVTPPPLPSSSSSRPPRKRPSHHYIQSTAEIQRKPRGRPPGSKNKPKPPVIVTKDSDSSMKPTILEISAGSDVIQSILGFARRNNASISVISASGSVSNVTLCNPAVASHHHTVSPSAISLHGPFNILSLSGSFLAKPFSNSSSSSSPSSCCCFGISLAGVQGQVFGGIVAGKVVAAGHVTVVGATFLNSSFHRLPIDDDHQNEADHDHHNDRDESVCNNNNNNNKNLSTGMSMGAYGVPAVASNPAPINCLPPHQHDVMHWGPSYRSSY